MSKTNDYGGSKHRGRHYTRIAAATRLIDWADRDERVHGIRLGVITPIRRRGGRVSLKVTVNDPGSLAVKVVGGGCAQELTLFVNHDEQLIAAINELYQ